MSTCEDAAILRCGRPLPVNRAKVYAASGHTSLWASWLWGASLSLADLSNVAGSNCLSVTSRMDSAAPPSTCPAPSDPSGRVHSQTFCARRNQFWRGAPRCRRQTPSCDGVSRRSSSQAPLSLYCFWLRCRLHMPSATLKRLNNQHHDALCRGHRKGSTLPLCGALLYARRAGMLAKAPWTVSQSVSLELSTATRTASLKACCCVSPKLGRGTRVGVRHCPSPKSNRHPGLSVISRNDRSPRVFQNTNHDSRFTGSMVVELLIRCNFVRSCEQINRHRRSGRRYEFIHFGNR